METIAFEHRTLDSTAAIPPNNIINVLNNANSSASEFELALKPFAATQWTRPIVEKLGIDKTNRVSGRLKRSPVPKPALRVVIDHFKVALGDKGALMPTHLTEWRTILTRYSLNQLADYSTWTLVIQFVIEQRIAGPGTLAEVNLAGIESLSISSPYGELIRALWQAVKLEFAAEKGLTPFAMQFRTKDFSLVEALRAQNVEESEFGLALAAAAEDLQLPENFSRLGPKARIIALQNIAPDSQPLLRFLSV